MPRHFTLIVKKCSECPCSTNAVTGEGEYCELTGYMIKDPESEVSDEFTDCPLVVVDNDGKYIKDVYVPDDIPF